MKKKKFHYVLIKSSKWNILNHLFVDFHSLPLLLFMRPNILPLILLVLFSVQVYTNNSALQQAVYANAYANATAMVNSYSKAYADATNAYYSNVYRNAYGGNNAQTQYRPPNAPVQQYPINWQNGYQNYLHYNCPNPQYPTQTKTTTYPQYPNMPIQYPTQPVASRYPQTPTYPKQPTYPKTPTTPVAPKQPIAPNIPK